MSVPSTSRLPDDKSIISKPHQSSLGYPEPANTVPVGPHQFLPIPRSSAKLQVNCIQSRDTKPILPAGPNATPPWIENFTNTPTRRTPSKALQISRSRDISPWKIGDIVNKNSEWRLTFHIVLLLKIRSRVEHDLTFNKQRVGSKRMSVPIPPSILLSFFVSIVSFFYLISAVSM
jgi:hypothetical protein